MNALLLAFALIASEQSYGPYARPVNGGDVAVAPARGGALLAWSEGNHIHTGMLDTHARLGEKIHTLPATTERAIAIAPAAASNGTSFLIAWLELVPGGERVTAMLAGIDGTPIGMPRHYGPTVPVATSEFALRVVWDGSAYRLWGSGKMFTIDAAGNVLATSDVSPRPQSVAASNGVIGTTAWRTAASCSGFSSITCNRVWDLVWTAGPASGFLRVASVFGLRPQVPVLSPSTMTSANGRFAIAWANANGVSYLMTGDGNNLVSALADTSVPPGLACDGERCLIAYSQSGDVRAFAFPIDRIFHPALETIAASERTERAPQVHTLGPGRFLVIYRSDGDGGSRSSWRTVAFDAPRRRAVR